MKSGKSRIYIYEGREAVIEMACNSTSVAVFVRFLLALAVAVAASLMCLLAAANAMCHLAFEEQDEDGESALEAFFGPFSLILLGDNLVVYNVY